MRVGVIPLTLAPKTCQPLDVDLEALKAEIVTESAHGKAAG